MTTDAKTIYAQSSDIKSRTYLEYRKDMKKKAIAELEILPWLREKIQKENKNALVEKYGGDKFIWFLRKGGITREPDFVVKYASNEEEYIEFQYAKNELKAYDFKISKISPKNRKLKMRIPKENTKILYIIKSISEYALIEPEWIIDNSKQTVAAAWGNAPVFRVNGKKFTEILKKDKKLKKVWELIDKKIAILDFQHELIDINKKRLSCLLQSVIDEGKIVKIIPRDLDSFFKVCFILDNLNKVPENANLWLVYLLSYIDKDTLLEDISKITYCIDFLYSKTELKPNELTLLVKKVKELLKKVKGFYNEDGSYKSSLELSPLYETRCALFSINLLEDLIQDMIFYYSVAELKPIQKIYENLENIEKTYELIKTAVAAAQ